MKKVMLEIKNLTKYYGKVLGVENLSLSLTEGEIFGFIGPNGAGKSTTIRSIMNLIDKTEGEILIEGKEYDKNDTKIKEMIGYLPSEIHLYDDFTVKEMLDYHESFYKKDIHSKRCELVSRLKLEESKKIEDLSLGNLKKVGIVLALMHDAKILIFDEATSGLDPIMQETFYEILKEEQKKGKTILYSTHVLSEVSKICNRVGMIKKGHLLKVQTLEEMKKNNFTLVTIKSPDIKKILSKLTGEIVFQEGDFVKLKNNLAPNDLMNVLSPYKIEKLFIEEATLEEIFLHDYE